MGNCGEKCDGKCGCSKPMYCESGYPPCNIWPRQELRLSNNGMECPQCGWVMPGTEFQNKKRSVVDRIRMA